MSASAKAIRKIRVSREDQSLVQNCLRGSEEAWSALIDKYKNLIFSIPIKRGFSPEDAADIFQAVCLKLVSELPRLREPRALPAWLIQTTLHTCFRWMDKSLPYAEMKLREEMLPHDLPMASEELLVELDREQMVRNAVAALSTDCKRLVDLLFYQMPPPSYDNLAASLEISKGSIGPTRRRCLEKLRRLLEKNGF